jgi:hypothetical protein
VSHTIKHDGWAMIFNSDMSGPVTFVGGGDAGTHDVEAEVPGELIQKYVEKYVLLEHLNGLVKLQQLLSWLDRWQPTPESFVMSMKGGFSGPGWQVRLQTCRGDDGEEIIGIGELLEEAIEDAQRQIEAPE